MSYFAVFFAAATVLGGEFLSENGPGSFVLFSYFLEFGLESQNAALDLSMN